MWQFFTEHWRDSIEILLLTIGVYQIQKALRETRAAQILLGLVILFVTLIALAKFCKLEVIQWIITRSGVVAAGAMIVIFQPELRNGLARLGSRRMFSFSSKRRLAFLESFTVSVLALSKKRIGALFAIQRDVSLKEYMDNGVKIDALFSHELSMAVFYPKAPLHDGGMVIANDRVSAAACVFPLTEKVVQDRTMGLRHRAGIGLTEKTDAIAIIVSEETGQISIAENGQLHQNLNEEQFHAMLQDIFISGKNVNESDLEQMATDPAVLPSRPDHLVSD